MLELRRRPSTRHDSFHTDRRLIMHPSTSIPPHTHCCSQRCHTFHAICPSVRFPSAETKSATIEARSHSNLVPHHQHASGRPDDGRWWVRESTRKGGDTVVRFPPRGRAELRRESEERSRVRSYCGQGWVASFLPSSIRRRTIFFPPHQCHPGTEESDAN